MNIYVWTIGGQCAYDFYTYTSCERSLQNSSNDELRGERVKRTSVFSDPSQQVYHVNNKNRTNEPTIM
jgi:hypothetical protein